MRALVVALALVCAVPVVAQDSETLADIRQQLTVLHVELQKLKQELNTTGTLGGALSGGSALDRVNAIETELVRLTAKTEQLENRINRVVADGTNRVGDLEFRLVELEGGDISKLAETTTLGGEALPQPAPAPVTTPEGPQLAVAEQADFERAQEALADEDFSTAAELFTAFNQTYPGGPLAAAAELGRGEALAGQGDTREAARAYLSAFSTDQAGLTAPVALYKLGAALGDLGQTNEACVTLGEVALRYPDADAVALAEEKKRALTCP